jgi:predicted glycogen debranching enzyme
MSGDFEYLSSHEWLETNGLGGFASATLCGVNSRRYHGLLVASLKPPVDRNILLSKLDETIIVDEDRFELGTNQYPSTVHPKGFQYLKNFNQDLFPVFTYEAGGIKLQKTIAAVHGENTTLIIYEVISAPKHFTLEWLPLCSFRDMHALSHASDYIYKGYVFDDGIFRTKNYQDSPEFFISIPGTDFKPAATWFYDLEYLTELQRGQDFKEDLFSHGRFSITLDAGQKVGIIISTEDPTGKDVFKLYKKELSRRELLIKEYAWNENVKRLVLAADQFIVKRGARLKTIIAGYHWFTDWGRDTMISLTGLCLVTGRFEDAKKILKAFADSISQGMLPNRFPDTGEIPEYNTVDATLWFFYAVFKYNQYTADVSFVKSLLPVLKNIIDHHIKGTRYQIHMDGDGLLYAGEDGVQLTWMDAKIDSYVVTPRKGKAVEINALWFNALSILKELYLQVTGDTRQAQVYQDHAIRVQNSFNELFWNETRSCLYDFIDGEIKNDDIRPNQIFAVSLPFKLLDKDRSMKVLEVVSQKLLTPRGLRSLSSDHKDFKQRYQGDRWERDNAYHQGTVWSFLLGPYIDAVISVKGSIGKKEASHILKEFFTHFEEAGIGTVSEIFDASPPYEAKGCIAQAWSVAELLRVSIEHELLENPSKKKKDATSKVHQDKSPA